MSWTVRGSLAILDQGLIAASNFVIGILLARWLLPEQYGGYALAFAIFLFLSFSYQAVLLEPQRVFGPSDYAHRQREYLGVLLWIHSGMAFAIFIALGISAWLVHMLVESPALPGALAGVTFAAPCVLLLWLVRGAYYVQMSPQYAVKGAVVYCVVVLGGLLLFYRIRFLSPFSAFLLMGMAALIASAVLLVRLRPTLKLNVGGPTWRMVSNQHWTYGRWILLSLVLGWLSGDIYYPVVSSFSGMAAAGELRALLNFSLPVAQTFGALSIFLLPHASRVYQENGAAALARLMRRTAWLFAVVAIAYWGAVIMLSKPLIHLLYSARYANVAALIPWVAAASLPWNVAMVPTIALRAARSSASILTTYFASSAVAVLIGVPSTKVFGLRGALCAMVLSNLATLLVAFILVSRKLKSDPIVK
jgi:O-antigen/teichoic acid export membrane protein